MMATSLGGLFGTREPVAPRNKPAATRGALGSPPGKTWATPRAAVGATTCRGKPFSKRTQKRGVAVVRKACRNRGSGVTAKNTPRAAVGASLENMFGAHLAVASATSSKTCRTPRAAAGAPPPEKRITPRRAAAGATSGCSQVPLRRISKPERKSTALAVRSRPRLGAAAEPLEVHRATHRCQSGRSQCLRCQYHDKGLKRRFPWSSERTKGSWAVGCVPCAMLGSARQAKGRLNKYACYEGLSQWKKGRTNTAAHSLMCHELSEAHKFAVSRFPCLPASAKPAIDICPATRSSNGSEENTKSAVGDESAALAADDAAAALARSDRKLLKGSVPQLQDWVDTWIAVTEGHSIRMQRRTQKKNGRIVRSRHCIRKQRRILAEHVREKNRILLRAATSITLALDKGKYKKVVRFRCDTPHASL